MPFSFSYLESFTTTFKLQIQTKDNRYKYTLSDFVVQDNPVESGDLSFPYVKAKGELAQKQHEKFGTI